MADDMPKPVEVPVAEHIEDLMRRATASFDLAAAHARVAAAYLPRYPQEGTAAVAAEAARNALFAALTLSKELHEAHRQIGALMAASERAGRQGELQ